jgi:IclR family transcriptional regulator, KDG regulon repressor
MSILQGTADVLRLISRLQRGVTMSDVVEHLGLPKSTASRMLKQLGEYGFLERDPQTLAYKPGLLLLEVAHLVHRTSSLSAHIEAALAELCQATGHTGYLSVLDGRDVLVLRVVPGTHALRLMTNPGTRSPAWATSTGRALLARLDDAALERDFSTNLEAGSAASPKTFPALLAQIELIRRRHWAVAVDEAVPGVGSVSCAVCDPQTGESAAFCLTFPLGMANAAEIERLAGLLTGQASRIGRTVGDAHWFLKAG